MSFYPHTRQLGAQSGIQLNPRKDNTEGFAGDNTDQLAAVFGRFPRGPIDRPFKVHAGNIRALLGSPEAIRKSALNEAYVQAYEAVMNGVYELVVNRLSVAGAVNKYAIFKIDSTSGATSVTASATAPTGDYLFALKDLECFNDGVVLKLHAIEKFNSSGVAQPSKEVVLQVCDPSGNIRYSFTGSLDQDAVDEYGQDYFLGTIIEKQTDTLPIIANASAVIPVNADCYGLASDGSDKYFSTGATPLILFTEGGTGYTTADYDRAIAQMEKSQFDVGYFFSAGSQAVALLSRMAALAIRANRPCVIDVPGSLTPAGAKAFVDQLNIDSDYIHFYWAPLKTDDPLNGGKAIIGTGGYNVARRCARNAQRNAHGLAPKNAPVAGKDYPLNRTGVKQIYTPDEPELSMLAKSQINPVISVAYSSGNRYVFADSLTAAKVLTSYRKLISVSEMASDLDDMIAKYAREALQKPMEVAIGMVDKFGKQLFDGARASGWLVASSDPVLGDKGYTLSVTRNLVSPADKMDITYGVHYDGVNRQTFITQTISQ